MDNNNEEKIYALAKDVMRLSRNTLVVNMRFLDTAISRLNCIPYKGTFACDGINISYDPVYLLKCYKKAKEIPTRSYLHMILHCIFRHNIVSTLVNNDYWDLACDMAAEAIINELDIQAVTVGKEAEQNAVMTEIHKKVKYLTAEKIYGYFMSKAVSDSKIEEWLRLFGTDDHSIWYEKQPMLNAESQENGQAESQSNGQADSDSDSYISVRESLIQDWKNISEKMQTDLETFSKHQGDKSGNLIQNLTAVNREKYDYTSFLKKFAVIGEAMKINDDEFDYIFYTYGLKMYDNMPLIEPLEYKDVKKIKEFVIAIDTSGSVEGELVQKFVQKTYNILKSTESFFSKINLHIIQCDTEIHEDVKITTQNEFDEYLKNMTIKGLGGTDFRPVFHHVNELIKNHEFNNLKGLIYFTDGYGDFPKRQPDYNTAFVFVDDEYNNPDVPVWAIKLVLQKDEI